MSRMFVFGISLHLMLRVSIKGRKQANKQIIARETKVNNCEKVALNSCPPPYTHTACITYVEDRFILPHSSQLPIHFPVSYHYKWANPKGGSKQWHDRSQKKEVIINTLLKTSYYWLLQTILRSNSYNYQVVYLIVVEINSSKMYHHRCSKLRFYFRIGRTVTPGYNGSRVKEIRF